MGSQSVKPRHKTSSRWRGRHRQHARMRALPRISCTPEPTNIVLGYCRASVSDAFFGSYGVGRGCGVGRGLGTGVGLTVAVGVGVGVRVGVGVGVTTGVGLAVGVGLGVGVGWGCN
jgi:hypothetical protein